MSFWKAFKLLDTSGNAQGVNVSSGIVPVSNTNLDAKLSDIKAKTDNLDVLLSTRLKGADTLTKVSTLDTITNALPTGTNSIGNVGSKIFDIITSTYKGLIFHSGVPQICSQSYLQALAEGDITYPTVHTPWSKIGFNGGITASTEADIWSATGAYVFPTSAAGMEFLSSDNTQDIGSVIFSGTSSGGTTTSLIDATKNFTAGTPVAVGDCIILDKSGTTPEWGYVTAVTSNTELAVAGGFSSGGTGSTRAYSILDKSAYTGAHAVKIEYLDGSYAQKSEIGILNGTTVIPTVNLDLFRINSFRIIATGTGSKPVGNLTLRNLADTPVYSYITAGFTRARNIMYTVPAGKTLYVTSGTFGYAYSHNSTHYARIYTRANIEPSTGFNTGSLFFPFSEFICSNNDVVREFECPTKLPAKTDLKVSVLADYAGIAQCTLRGWLE